MSDRRKAAGPGPCGSAAAAADPAQAAADINNLVRFCAACPRVLHSKNAVGLCPECVERVDAFDKVMRRFRLPFHDENAVEFWIAVYAARLEAGERLFDALEEIRFGLDRIRGGPPPPVKVRSPAVPHKSTAYKARNRDCSRRAAS